MRKLFLTTCLTITALTVATSLWAQDGSTSDPDSACSAVAKARRALWKASISAPQDARDPALEASVKRLGSLIGVLDNRKDWPEPPRPETDDPTMRIRPPAPKPAPSAEAKATPRPTPITPETLAKLKKLAPGGAANATALADALYKSGHRESATVLYKMAARGATGEEALAWLLFQTANCLRETDPKAALAIYNRVVAEHPKSLWSDIARVQARLIRWRNTDRLASQLDEITKE